VPLLLLLVVLVARLVVVVVVVVMALLLAALQRHAAAGPGRAALPYVRTVYCTYCGSRVDDQFRTFRELPLTGGLLDLKTSGVDGRDRAAARSMAHTRCCETSR
jgi:hypothetical protein